MNNHHKIYIPQVNIIRFCHTREHENVRLFLDKCSTNFSRSRKERQRSITYLHIFEDVTTIVISL
jgi:hypothetical protein